MFGKRKQRDSKRDWQEPTATPPAAGSEQPASSEPQKPSPAPSKPAPKPDASAVLNRHGASSGRPEQQPRRAAAARPAARGEPAESKKLIVGREIALSGEIRSCDMLIVEGSVDAELSDSAALEVTPSGVFKGSAVIDEAEIAGRFDGDLTVRERLYLRATGQVTGTIRYRGLEIESGGRIGGTLIELSEDDLKDLPDGAATAAATEQPRPATSETPEPSQALGDAAGRDPLRDLNVDKPDSSGTADTFAWPDRGSAHG